MSKLFSGKKKEYISMCRLLKRLPLIKYKEVNASSSISLCNMI